MLKNVGSSVSVMKTTRIIQILIGFFLLVPLVRSTNLDYYIIVEENGNSLAIITFHGNGLVNIPVQEDVEEVKVKGALYRLNDDSVDISIGSTEEAVLLYQTKLLTEKEGDTWRFRMNLTGLEKNEVVVVMTNKTVIKNTEPAVFIENRDLLKLIWEDSPDDVLIEYSYVIGDVDEIVDSQNPEEKSTMKYGLIIIVSCGIFMTISMILYFKKKTRKNKQNIMKTLPENENKIVSIILENKGEIKRSKLERKSDIPKSSLASALKNLERKKIVELDRTYKSHYVKFTKWFNEL